MRFCFAEDPSTCNAAGELYIARGSVHLLVPGCQEWVGLNAAENMSTCKGWTLQYASSEGLAALAGGLDRFGAAYASVVQPARPLITRFCFSEETSTFLCGSWSWGVDKCVLARCWRVAL